MKQTSSQHKIKTYQVSLIAPISIMSKTPPAITVSPEPYLNISHISQSWCCARVRCACFFRCFFCVSPQGAKRSDFFFFFSEKAQATHLRSTRKRHGGRLSTPSKSYITGNITVLVLILLIVLIGTHPTDRQPCQPVSRIPGNMREHSR